MNIVGVSAEVAPWSKAGGLGDVAGALPIALAARGHRVMTIAPRYKEYPDAWDTGVRIRVFLFGQEHTVGVYHVWSRGVDRVFLDHPALRRGAVYGDSRGAFGDNQFRFALLSRAALEVPRRLVLDGSVFGEDVAFWANDWHASLVPLYLRALYKPVGLYERAPVVLGLHNLAHQGGFSADTFPGLDLAPRWGQALDMHGFVNTLKAGLVSADRVITVSPNYADEVRTEAGGWGLDGILRARGAAVQGILNGVDTDEWDPAADPHTEAAYTADDMAGKAACKAALQREFGLPERPEVPLFGFIGRLDFQKGVDLIRGAAPWLLAQDVQLVMLGSGAPDLEAFLRGVSAQWPGRARGHVGFSVPLAHRITAGADLLLMPSRFEPCGLNQLYALRYGTVPVVSATGGLYDTVHHYTPAEDTGTGWTFSPATPEALARALGWALLTWSDYPEVFRRIQARGMAQDVSWARSAEAYEAAFAELMAD